MQSPKQPRYFAETAVGAVVLLFPDWSREALLPMVDRQKVPASGTSVTA